MSGPDACGSQKRAPKTARNARNIPLRITSPNHGAFSSWIPVMIERLLRTVEKGPTTSRPDVGTSRRDLRSGPPVGTSRGVPLWGPGFGLGPHCKPRRHGTTSGRDAAPRRLPATLRGVVSATAASRTAAQRVRSSNAPGRCASRTTLPVARARPACVHSGAASLQSSSARQASCSSAADQAPRLAGAQRPSAGGEALPGNPGAASEAFRGRSWLCQSRGQLDK